MRSYFVFNGHDSRTLGIYLRTPPPVQRARERVNDVTIRGRGGTLTLLEGRGIYEPYTVSLTVSIHGDALNSDIFGILSGGGLVIFSSQPEFCQQARIVNPLTLNRVSPGLDWYSGALVFYCQPYKRLLHEDSLTLTTQAQEVHNLGDVPEKPLFRVSGSGDVSITVNGLEFTLTNLPAPGAIIDCAACEVVSPDETQLLTALSAGEFPQLDTGANTISFNGAGVTSLTLERRQRWL